MSYSSEKQGTDCKTGGGECKSEMYWCKPAAKPCSFLLSLCQLKPLFVKYCLFCSQNMQVWFSQWLCFYQLSVGPWLVCIGDLHLPN